MNEINGIRDRVKVIDDKLDRLIESVARMEVNSVRDAENVDSSIKRISTLEQRIQKFENNNQYLKGQIRMLTIIGSVAVGFAAISHVIIRLLSL